MFGPKVGTDIPFSLWLYFNKELDKMQKFKLILPILDHLCQVLIVLLELETKLAVVKPSITELIILPKLMVM